MRNTLVAIAMLFAACASFAQNASPTALKTHILEVHNRQAEDVASAVRPLLSGAPGSEIIITHELRTLTVRDYPENVAAIEDAVKRLDVPRAASADGTLRMWIVIASKTAVPNTGALPEEIEPVVRELKSTLRYSNYALLSAMVSHVSSGTTVDGSGIAEASVIGIGKDGAQPPIYTYHLIEPAIATGERRALATDRFKFGVRIPIDTGKGINYQDVGFETPVTIRDGEKVVIGTTTMCDKALIVVVTFEIAK